MVEEITLLSVKAELTNWSSVAKSAIENCSKIKKERENEILVSRFGIGEAPKTLQAIGDKYGITRERVRQIVNNSLKKIVANCTSEEIKRNISQIEKYVSENGGYASFKQLNTLTDGTEDEKNSLFFVSCLSKKLEEVKTSNDFRGGFRRNGLKISTLKHTSNKALNALKKGGNVLSVKEIGKLIDENPELITAALSASPQAMQTDGNKWGLVSWPHVNPKSIRDKSRFVMEKHGKPLHYGQLAKKISDIGNKKVTKQSVHNELIKNSDFVLVGRGIYALSSWGYKPGIVEEVIVEVLTEANGPLHKKVIIEEVLKRRVVKPNTVVLNLQKDRFKKVGKAVYTLN